MYKVQKKSSNNIRQGEMLENSRGMAPHASWLAKLATSNYHNRSAKWDLARIHNTRPDLSVNKQWFAWVGRLGGGGYIVCLLFLFLF